MPAWIYIRSRERPSGDSCSSMVEQSDTAFLLTIGRSGRVDFPRKSGGCRNVPKSCNPQVNLRSFCAYRAIRSATPRRCAIEALVRTPILATFHRRESNGSDGRNGPCCPDARQLVGIRGDDTLPVGRYTKRERIYRGLRRAESGSKSDENTSFTR